MASRELTSLVAILRQPFQEAAVLPPDIACLLLVDCLRYQTWYVDAHCLPKVAMGRCWRLPCCDGRLVDGSVSFKVFTDDHHSLIASLSSSLLRVADSTDLS